MGSVFVDFPSLVTNLDVTPTHIIHVGAHRGEEVDFYKQAGAERITLVEPIPELAELLRDRYEDDLSITIVEAACGAAPTTATLNIMQKTNLSTLHEPQRSDRLDRIIDVSVVRLDSIQGDANVAVIDAQGLELEVLGAADMSKFDLVIAECCTKDDPTIAVGYDAMVEFMASVGFREVNKWSRDYQWINKWSRGTKARFHRGDGSVYDAAFVPGEPE
ncbi:methyltransferase [Streptomyces phage Lizz]|nr:methyltransferase [Streptomyces phage PHTowN]QYW07580.1 methyltransferase [Streptomyces phage Lizz]